MDKTPVIFRKYRNSRGGEVVALFPAEAWSADGRTCPCYVHLGQHGEADPQAVVNMTRAATPAEYADLKAELEAEPYRYRLHVIKRLHRAYADLRRASLRDADGNERIGKSDAEWNAEAEADERQRGGGPFDPVTGKDRYGNTAPGRTETDDAIRRGTAAEMGVKKPPAPSISRKSRAVLEETARQFGPALKRLAEQ